MVLTVFSVKEQIGRTKQRGDVVVASIHWGGKWGYDVSEEQREFAHNLVDEANVDVIHGHSSHHAKGIEVYKERPICYGCGDFLNNYEGISGFEFYRGGLGLTYFVTIDASTGRLVSLQMTPTQVKCFRVNRASGADGLWLRNILNREGERFGTRVDLSKNNLITLRWN